MNTSRKGFLFSLAALFLPIPALPKPPPNFSARKVGFIYADEFDSAFEEGMEIGWRTVERPIGEHPNFHHLSGKYLSVGLS